MSYKSELSTYPNLYSRALPFLVECAKDENLGNAKMAFQRTCAKFFKINSVQWLRKRDEPYCRWRMEYIFEGLALLPDEGEEHKKYFTMLEKHRPSNTDIVDVGRSTNAAILEYGILDCRCARPVFDELGPRPVQSQLGIINKELKNLKIIDEKKIIIQ